MRSVMLRVFCAVAFALAAGTAQAAPVEVNSRAALGLVGYLDWGTVLTGGDFDTAASPINGTTTSGEGVTASDVDGFVLLVQDSSYFGGFGAGENLLGTSDFTEVEGNLTWSRSLQIDLDTAVNGAGLSVQANDIGAFTVQLQVYDLFANLLGTFTESGNSQIGSGTVYLGALSGIAEIGRLVYTITEFTNNPDFPGYNGFAVNRLDP